MTTGSRRTETERRDQIREVGARAFAALPYRDVRMDRIAAEAGISRALLYRHFASKDDLFVAVFQRAIDERVADTAAQAGLPLAEQVAAGLDTYIDYFATHRHTVLAANRELAGHPTVQAIIDTEFRVLRDRLLATVELRDRPPAAVGALVMAWLVFVRVLCVEWLSTQAFSRDLLRGMCLGAFLGAVGQPALPA